MEAITLNLKPGDLLGVIGKVGSGKTTLLNSLMGETNLESGTSSVNGSIAYVA